MLSPLRMYCSGPTRGMATAKSARSGCGLGLSPSALLSAVLPLGLPDHPDAIGAVDSLVLESTIAVLRPAERVPVTVREMQHVLAPRYGEELGLCGLGLLGRLTDTALRSTSFATTGNAGGDATLRGGVTWYSPAPR